MATVYHAQFQCEVCFEWFDAEFYDPKKSFEATCANCGTHYPELYV